MPVFEYEAIGPDGKTVRGTQFGSSGPAVENALMARGFQVQAVRFASGAGPAPVSVPQNAVHANQVARGMGTPMPDLLDVQSVSVRQALFGNVSNRDLSDFFRRTWTLLEAGMNPNETFVSLRNRVNKGPMTSILDDLVQTTHQGNRISEALVRYPQVFSPVILNIIQAGEAGGFLADACLQVSQYLDDIEESVRHAKRQSLYPKLVIGLTVLVPLVANLIIRFVRPEGRTIYSPLLDPWVWQFLGPVLVIILIFKFYLNKRKDVGGFMSSLRLSLPLLGDIERLNTMSRFARSFAALYKAGVPMAQTLEVSAKATGNAHLEQQLMRAMPMIRAGHPVSQSLDSVGIFDHQVIDMLHVGERSGDIDGLLVRISHYYREEAKSKELRNGHLIGIFVFLIAAIIVFVMMLKFYSGYFSDILSNANE